jgi:hypothetical protein
LRLGVFELGADAALTGQVQASNPGTFGTVGLRLTAFPGARLGSVFIAVELGWEQPLVTLLAPGAILTAAWSDSPAPAGVRAWAFPFTRFHTGLHASVALTSHLDLFGGFAFIWTPNTLGVGSFDPMMFGFWPFGATLGVLARW